MLFSDKISTNKNKIQSVSVLIPTHNRDWLLKKTLDSLAQVEISTEVTLEVIVTANACTDNTLNLLIEYQKTFPYSLKFFDEIKPGANIARNRCLQEAKGEILAIVDDDVQFDKEWLVGLVESFENFSVDIVGGRILLWWEAVKPPEWLNPQLEILLSAYDLGNEVIQVDLPGPIAANLAFRRHVYEQLGFMHTGIQNKNNKINRGDEVEYLYRAKKAGFKAMYVPKALVHHWVSPNKLSSNFFKIAGLGFGNSRIYLQDKLSIFIFLKSLLGFSYLAFRYGVAMLLTQNTKNQSAYLQNLYTCMVGVGGLQGTLERLFAKTM
jgi:glycosyltransferase involved in cell wall biosynthesis